jgi:hypothetical protein
MDSGPEVYTRRTWIIGSQGAWIWVQYKAEIRKHITHMASISNAVMGPKTGDMEAKDLGATGIRPAEVPGGAEKPLRFAPKGRTVHRKAKVSNPVCSQDSGVAQGATHDRRTRQTRRVSGVRSIGQQRAITHNTIGGRNTVSTSITTVKWHELCVL